MRNVRAIVGISSTNVSSNRGQHHYAQVLLRGFGNDGAIRVYERPRQVHGEVRSFETTTKNIAKERDLYSITTNSGHEQYIDDNLRMIENLVPGLLHSVVRNYELSAVQWEALKSLAAIQHLRAPGLIASLADFVSDKQRIIRYLYRKHRSELTNEDIEALLRSESGIERLEGSHSIEPRNVALATMNSAVPFFAAELHKMHGSIVTSMAQDFITSDRPVVWFDPLHYPPRKFFGFNKQSPSIEMTFPLTRQKVLILARQPMMQYACANELAVTIINSRTAFGARKHIYTYPTRDPLEAARQKADILSELGSLSLLSLLIERDGFAMSPHYGSPHTGS